MAKRTKVAASGLPVPQSMAEAKETITEIGRTEREIARLDLAHQERVANSKARLEAATGPLAEANARRIEGLRCWADANRAALTQGGRTKTVDLGTGTISWRIKPPKVSVKGGDEGAIAALKAAGLTRFVRVKEELDRQAIRAEPAAVKAINSITIGTEGEDFEVVAAGGDEAASQATEVAS